MPITKKQNAKNINVNNFTPNMVRTRYQHNERNTMHTLYTEIWCFQVYNK